MAKLGYISVTGGVHDHMNLEIPSAVPCIMFFAAVFPSRIPVVPKMGKVVAGFETVQPNRRAKRNAKRQTGPK